VNLFRADDVETSEVLLTVRDWEILDEAGALAHLPRRMELIDGRLYALAAIRADHSRVSSQLIVELSAALRISGLQDRYFVADAPTLVLSDTRAPQPDAAVARREHGRYLAPADVEMVAETTLSSQTNDRAVKATWYAEARLPEYWIADVERRTVLVSRRPVSGVYTDVQEYDGTARIATLLAPNAPIDLAAVFR
jgi:Uma2 family endonuclease